MGTSETLIATLSYAAVVVTLDPSENLEPDAPARVPETITGFLACLTCRYDLIGLPTAGICPECSTPVLDSYRAKYDASVIERRGLGERLHRCQLALAGVAIGIVIASLTMGVSFLAFLAALGALACWVWWLAEWIGFFSPLRGLTTTDTGLILGQVVSGVLILLSLACMPALCGGLASSQTTAVVLFMGYLATFTLHQHLALRRTRYFMELIEADAQTAGSPWGAHAMRGLGVVYLLGATLWYVLGPRPSGLITFGWYPAISLIYWLIVLDFAQRRVKRLLPQAR